MDIQIKNLIYIKISGLSYLILILNIVQVAS